MGLTPLETECPDDPLNRLKQLRGFFRMTLLNESREFNPGWEQEVGYLFLIRWRFD